MYQSTHFFVILSNIVDYQSDCCPPCFYGATIVTNYDVFPRGMRQVPLLLNRKYFASFR